MKEVSDGNLYVSSDLVKIGTGDCSGCSLCCHVTADTILLDPYDIYNLQKATGRVFTELYGSILAFGQGDGLILPHLKVNDESGCPLLDEKGRCSIHDFRPGFCRLFPLGRIYENGGFKYYIQVKECPYPNKSKVKIKNWLGIERLKDYETYILDWHERTEKHSEKISGLMRQLTAEGVRPSIDNGAAKEPSGSADDCAKADGSGLLAQASAESTAFLKRFFLIPYDTERDFYEQYYERCNNEN